ncbi:hypothetical protein [Streptomyces sp. NPDC020597]|uniref:hypothetical protein n=1 Tax=unclassified Streptomyces TaxID=2593676 RepID=UPI0037B684BC
MQLTSGDHGEPKDKKSKSPRKPTVQGGKGSRAAKLREVERFREAIRAAEQRRTARQDSPSTALRPTQAGTHQILGHSPTRTDADTTLQAHLAACIQAVQTHDRSGLAAHARRLADAADRLDAKADRRPGIERPAQAPRRGRVRPKASHRAASDHQLQVISRIDPARRSGERPLGWTVSPAASCRWGPKKGTWPVRCRRMAPHTGLRPTDGYGSAVLPCRAA